MRLIIVPDGTGRQSHTCLTARQVRSLLVLVVLVLPLSLGAAGYWLKGRLDAAPRADHARVEEARALLSEWREQMMSQMGSVAETRQRIEDDLDALGMRVGSLQAQVSRINALGQRLTDMAGLEMVEFSFEDEPGVGGPESLSMEEDAAARDLVALLDDLEARLVDKQEELEILENLMTDRTLHRKHFPNGWPVEEGWLSSGYGYRNDPFSGRRAFHAGVDIASRKGAPIHAVAGGVVTFAGVRAGYGLMVEITHGNGYITRYAHALAKTVTAGDRVEKGDIVAVVGSSGRSTGAHLHFEVVRNGRTVNPRKYLRANG
jgi:murein DD-endopeptidase MepM/ murein hydrolase activator NlpD